MQPRCSWPVQLVAVRTQASSAIHDPIVSKARDHIRRMFVKGLLVTGLSLRPSRAHDLDRRVCRIFV